jgi:hypothetical protein
MPESATRNIIKQAGEIKFIAAYVKIIGKTTSANGDAASKYPDVLKKIIEDGSYTDQQIFNVDETGICMKI